MLNLILFVATVKHKVVALFPAISVDFRQSDHLKPFCFCVHEKLQSSQIFVKSMSLTKHDIFHLTIHQDERNSTNDEKLFSYYMKMNGDILSMMFFHMPGSLNSTSSVIKLLRIKLRIITLEPNFITSLCMLSF